MTSLEHVSVLEHAPGDSFVVCLSGDQENVIDGYYRMRVTRQEGAVRVDYAKVQSLTSAAMRLISGRETYAKENEKSARKTADLLAKYVREGGG